MMASCAIVSFVFRESDMKVIWSLMISTILTKDCKTALMEARRIFSFFFLSSSCIAFESSSSVFFNACFSFSISVCKLSSVFSHAPDSLLFPGFSGGFIFWCIIFPLGGLLSPPPKLELKFGGSVGILGESFGAVGAISCFPLSSLAASLFLISSKAFASLISASVIFLFPFAKCLIANGYVFNMYAKGQK